jgi:hypothetical protein
MSSTDNPVEPENLIAAVIDAAEDIRDPLDGLVEKTATDPGAPFVPEALERLAALKKVNRAGFEALRAQLKKAGCRVTVLDEAIAEEKREARGRGPTQADILIELAQPAELFHTPDGTGFADLDINSHRETWPIRAKGFRRWLARRFFEATQGAPSSESLQSALNVIEAKAHFDAPERMGPYPSRRARWPPLSRPRRRDLAGRGDRHQRLAGDRQPAGAIPPRRRHGRCRSRLRADRSRRRGPFSTCTPIRTSC